jgi:hypothetical protein
VSGISSRKGTIAFAVQTAKGSPATVPAVKFKLSGAPSLMPSRTIARYNTTDKGQDPGPAYVSQMGVSGDVPVYVHPDGAAFLFNAVMGQAVDTGATPNFVHTMTYADDVPWLTVWREVGGVITEQFVDVKATDLKISGQAGQPLTATLSLIGLQAAPLGAGAVLTALQALASLASKGYIYPEAAGAIKLNAVASKIHQIDVEFNRNASPYQADDYVATDVDMGGRDTSLSFATRFQSGAIGVTDYYKFFYGPNGATGTKLDPTLGTQPFEVTFVRDANTSIDILLPSVSYAAMPVNPDPSGNPIEVQVACNVEPNPDGVTPIATVVVKDQKAKATIL